MTLEYHCRSNSGGCLKSLNIASPRWRPFKWDIRFVVLKRDAFFPPLRILAEHTLLIAMALSSSATEKNFQTGDRRHVHKWWRNERDTSTCTRKADESQINQTDWLIYQQATLSDLVIGFHLFIGAIKMTSFSPISVDNLSVRQISCIPNIFGSLWNCGSLPEST